MRKIGYARVSSTDQNLIVSSVPHVPNAVT